MATDNDKNVKQGAVTAGRLRIEGFRGAYRDARFNDDGVSEGPVSDETREALRNDFPNAKVETVKEAKAEEK